MKILLDECTPHAVEKGLPTRDIRTVHEMGWAGVKNGELLKRAEAEFDIFITTDKNLRHQQNLSGRKLAFIVLPSNQVLVVAALIPGERMLHVGERPAGLWVGEDVPAVARPAEPFQLRRHLRGHRDGPALPALSPLDVDHAEVHIDLPRRCTTESGQGRARLINR